MNQNETNPSTAIVVPITYNKGTDVEATFPRRVEIYVFTEATGCHSANIWASGGFLKDYQKHWQFGRGKNEYKLALDKYNELVNKYLSKDEATVAVD